MSQASRFRTLLKRDGMVVAPGAYDCITAKLIEQAGFAAVYLTGAGLTNMYLGLPDLGFMDLSQLAAHVMAIRSVVDLPLIADADTGFGNAVNMTHTVRILEQAGASGSACATVVPAIEAAPVKNWIGANSNATSANIRSDVQSCAGAAADSP